MSSNSLEHGVELADNGSDVGTPQNGVLEMG